MAVAILAGIHYWIGCLGARVSRTLTTATVTSTVPRRRPLHH